MSESVLKIEIDELKNSISHLERSNRELKELLETDPDPEYRLAIGENITTIAKKRARVAALEEELRRITGQHLSEGVSVPVEDSDASISNGEAAAFTGEARTANASSTNGVPDAMLMDGPEPSAGPTVPAAMDTDGQACTEGQPDPNGGMPDPPGASVASAPAALSSAGAASTVAVPESVSGGLAAEGAGNTPEGGVWL